MKTSKNLSGFNIARFRLEKGWSQKELQLRLRVVGMRISRPVIAKIENASRCVSDFELVAFSRALGVTPKRLLRQRRLGR